MSEKAREKKAPPIAYLLKASDADVGNFELAKLSEVANLHSEMFTAAVKNLRNEMVAMFERIVERTKEEMRIQDAKFYELVDASALSMLAAWLRTIDRDELRRQLLESPHTTLDAILAEAKAQIRDAGRNPEEAESYGMRIYPPGVAHRNAAKRYQARNIEAHLCEKCPEPQDPSSTRYCPHHLAIEREKDRQKNFKRGKRGNPNAEPGTRAWLYGDGTVEQSTHGRQPGTLNALRESNEKRKRGSAGPHE